jgi:aspartate racemase
MLTVGLLGGMSWESSVEYERLINTEIRRRRGGAAAGDLLVRSYDFSRIEQLQEAGSWDEMGALLAGDAARLEAAGADLLALCTNTMHKVADRIEAAVTVPFLHLGDATAAAANEAGCTTVGLLGTRYTMEQDFYRDRLASHGLTVLVPDATDRDVIHRVIYDELIQGIVSEKSRTQYLEVIDRLRDRGATGVIAGCTEIELLVKPDDLDCPYFATTHLHAMAIVDAALGAAST